MGLSGDSCCIDTFWRRPINQSIHPSTQCPQYSGNSQIWDPVLSMPAYNSPPDFFATCMHDSMPSKSHHHIYSNLDLCQRELGQECVFTTVTTSVEPVMDATTDTDTAATMNSWDHFVGSSSNGKSVLSSFKTVNTIKGKKRKNSAHSSFDKKSVGIAAAKLPSVVHNIKQLAVSDNDVFCDQDNAHNVAFTKKEN